MTIKSMGTELIEVAFSREEFRTLVHAMNEVCYAGTVIRRGEFDARMGVSKERAEALLDQMSNFWQSFARK